jgi:hypothetical protein
MDLLQSVHALLQLDVIVGQLCLPKVEVSSIQSRCRHLFGPAYLLVRLAQLFPNILLRSSGEGRKSGTVRSDDSPPIR